MERITQKRVAVFFVLLAALLGFFAFRLYIVQVVNATDGDSSISTYTYQTNVSAARGQILDRNGNILVSNRASYNVIINDYVLFNSESPNEDLLRLVRLCDKLGIDYADHLPITAEKPYAYTLEELPEAWQGYFRAYLNAYTWDADISAQQIIKLMKSVYKIPNDWDEAEARKVLGLRYELKLRSCASLDPYVLVADVNSTDLAALMELDIPGMSVETTTVREYNTTYAAHILGRVGLMDSDEYKKYKEQDYSMNAYVGKDGLEKSFESYLHGTDGIRLTTVTSNGEVVDEHYAVEPKAGNNVELTIDIDLQAVAEKALESCILDLRENGVGKDGEGKDAEGGAAVVMSVKTAEVLASASYPTFNLATYTEDFNKLNADETAPLYNRALSAIYPPGSIYKMVTAIAAIDSGTASRYLQIEDQGIYRYYDDYQPACYIYTASGVTHGVVDMMQAISVSCNYYFYEVGRRTGIDAIDQTAKQLGLGEDTGVEIANADGYRANPETKEKLYADDPDQSGWYGADTLMASIGQSENKFTPLQMCVYTTALANKGTRYEAHFLKKIISGDYQTLLEEKTPKVASTLDMSQDAIDCVFTGMRLCATEGTAKNIFENYDVAVCCKTGTAQHGAEGSDNASFVLFAPADDPEIAISVYVEKGAQGGNLGKVAKEILDYYFSTTVQRETSPQEGLLQ